MSLPVTAASLALTFAASAVVVVVAGTKLARGGDVIAARTKLGGVWSARSSWRSRPRSPS